MSETSLTEKNLDWLRTSIKEQMDLILKGVAYLMTAHGAGLVGCLTLLKDYNSVPQLKGIGFFMMVDLLDDARIFAQIVGLERRTARGGRDSIDHAPGAQDDVVNAAAGVVDLLTASKSEYDSMQWVSGPYDDDDDDGPPMIRTPRGTGRIDSRH
jgi:hypothetical protein